MISYLYKLVPCWVFCIAGRCCLQEGNRHQRNHMILNLFWCGVKFIFLNSFMISFLLHATSGPKEILLIPSLSSWYNLFICVWQLLVNWEYKLPLSPKPQLRCGNPWEHRILHLQIFLPMVHDCWTGFETWPSSAKVYLDLQ